MNPADPTPTASGAAGAKKKMSENSPFLLFLKQLGILFTHRELKLLVHSSCLNPGTQYH